MKKLFTILTLFASLINAADNKKEETANRYIPKLHGAINILADTLFTFVVPNQLILGVCVINDSTIIFSSAGQSSATIPDNKWIVTNFSGRIIDSTKAQTTSTQGWGFRDLAFTGKYILASENNIIHRVNPFTFDETATPITNISQALHRGLGYDNGFIYSTNFTSAPMSIIDTTGVTKRIYPAVPTSAPYGIAVDKFSNPTKTSIWYATPSLAGTISLSRVDSATGAINLVLDLTAKLIPGAVPATATVGGFDIVYNHPKYPKKIIGLIVIQNSPNSKLIAIDLGTPFANDISAEEFVSPKIFGGVQPNIKFNPTAKFANRGYLTQNNISVEYQVVDSSNISKYKSTKTISSLVSGSAVTIEFDSLSGGFTKGKYKSTIKIINADEDLSNNLLNGTLNVQEMLNGEIKVGPTETIKTITEAIAAINAIGIAGPTTILLSGENYSTETFPIEITEVLGSSSTNTVIIKPAANKKPIIVTGGTSSFVFKFNNASNFIIDGSNTTNGKTRDLTIKNDNKNTLNGAIWISSQGAGKGNKNITIKNCTIMAGDTNSSNFGIYIAGATISSTGSGDDNDNITIENNSIKRVTTAIYARGTTAGMMDLLTIRKNSIGGLIESEYISLRGIDVGAITGSVIVQNEIFNIETRRFSNIIGISVLSTVTNSIIDGNKISQLRSLSADGWGAYGIDCAGNEILISNNMIHEIYTHGYQDINNAYNPMGIRISGGANTKIINNSVYISGWFTNISAGFTGSGKAFSSALVISSTLATGIELQNNIFVNTMVGGDSAICYAIITPTGYKFAKNNYNNYFVNGANGILLRRGTSISSGVDIKLWSVFKDSLGQETKSANQNPKFKNESDLHLNTTITPNFLMGLPSSLVLKDFDGDTRSTTAPYMGADEDVNKLLKNNEDYVVLPKKFVVYQNYPNPFNPTTTIKYYLPERSRVKITITNVIGQKVSQVEEGNKDRGMHEYSFNGKDVSAGTYFYRIETEKYSETKKFLLVK